MAITIKPKPINPKVKKDAAIMKAEEARRKRQKDKLKKEAAKSYYSSVKGYKGKAAGMNPTALSYKEKRAKELRAQIREAARSGQTVSQTQLAGRLANLKRNVNKLQQEIITLSKGRK